MMTHEGWSSECWNNRDILLSRGGDTFVRPERASVGRTERESGTESRLGESLWPFTRVSLVKKIV